MVFKISDFLVYPGHGIGKITNCVSKELTGKQVNFLTIVILHSQMKVMVPTDHLESMGIRKLSSKDDIFAILDDMKEVQFIDRGTSWNVVYRELMENIKSGEFYKICRTYKQLLVLKTQRELSFGEKKLWDVCKMLLIDEISMALGLQELESEELLNEKVS